MSTITPEEPNDRTKLRDIFTAPYDKHQSLWSDLWNKGDWLPWDRAYSNPALTDALRTRTDLLGTSLEAATTQNSVTDRGALAGQRRKTALVPGCGRGYDVLLLASLGYDAYGLEVSEKAVEACVLNAAETYDKYKDEQAGEGKSDAGGRYTFIQGDFFKDEWLELSALSDKDFKFDFIYDYTFFCALPFEARPAWALRMSQLLAKEGRLLCLEFPLYKDPKTQGPPFGLSGDAYVAHLSRPGEKLSYTEALYPEGTAEEHIKKRTGMALERMDRWKAERTHKIGEGTDHVSVWKHV